MGSEKAKMSKNKAEQLHEYAVRLGHQALLDSKTREAESLCMFEQFEAVEAARIKAEEDAQEEFMNDLRAL